MIVLTKHITKIVITGGPCAGKTTAMASIKEHFTRLGYYVVFVPETATELITAGIAPWTIGSVYEYQCCQMKLQTEKEKIYFEAAQKLRCSDKILLVHDRGVVDCRAYMGDTDYLKAIAESGFNEMDVLLRYDAVFHLVTAAKGACEFYSCESNCARTEGIEEALDIDNKLIDAWKNHPRYTIIESSNDFENKISTLISAIAEYLGEN